MGEEGEDFEKSTGGLVCNGVKVFCEEEFGVEHEAKVTDMWIPRDRGVLKLELARECRAAFSK